ncbi:MAG: citryl-CoA lyase, partial [Actinomycetia bacterium]|nr:citryl-CoA lyase [Actinomycetes bacterium]
MTSNGPTTAIATHDAQDVFIRGASLSRELIGELSFTEMIVFQMLGRRLTPELTAVIDACLVTLVEHGLTPSALATRLIYSSAPDAMQGAVAAGLLGVGGVFVGSMEGNAALLARMIAAADTEAEATAIADEHRAGEPAVAHAQLA